MGIKCVFCGKQLTGSLDQPARFHHDIPVDVVVEQG